VELRKTAQGKSEKFENWRDSKRAAVYGGCVASVLCGPACVAACYGIAAPILESEISDYKEAVEKWTKEYNKFADGYDALAGMAMQSSVVAKKWWTTTQDFENALQTQYNFLSAFKNVAIVNYGIRQLIVSNLGKLITACDEVEATTGGRLEEYQKLDEEESLFY